MSRTAHYIEHHCGFQECDCEVACRAEGDLSVTAHKSEVTCKNCLRSIAAWAKRAEKARAASMRAREAFATECAF